MPVFRLQKNLQTNITNSKGYFAVEKLVMILNISDIFLQISIRFVNVMANSIDTHLRLKMFLSHYHTKRI